MSTGRQFPLSIVITGVDRLTGTLNRVTAGLRRATAPLVPLQNSVAGLRRSFSEMGEAAGVPQLAERFKAVGAAISGVGTAATTTFRRITGLTVGAGGFAYLFKRQFLDAAAHLESLQMRLEGLEGGDQTKARASMAFIRRTTDRSPFDRTAVADTFTMMRGFGMDPTKSMQPIIDQVAKLGRSSESLSGIALQLGQAFGKGRLMAQDANILVENGIAVWQILDRAVERVTGRKPGIAKLREMSEKGQLDVQYINLLIEQMGEEAKGSAEKMTHSFTGMMTRLANQWRYFKERVMAGGAFAQLKVTLQIILSRIDEMSRNGQLQAWANRVSRALLTAFDWLKTDGLRTMRSLASTAADLFRAVDKVAKAFGEDGWGRIIKIGLATYIGKDLAIAVGKLGLSLFTLQGSLALTPLGRFAIAVTGAIVLVTTLWTHWREFSDNWAGIFSGMADVFGGFVDLIVGKTDRLLRGVQTIFNVVRRTPIGRAMFGAPTASAADTPSADDIPTPRAFRSVAPRLLPDAPTSWFFRAGSQPFHLGPAVGVTAARGELSYPAVSPFAAELNRLEAALQRQIDERPELRLLIENRNAPPGTRMTVTPAGPRVDLTTRLRMAPAMADAW